MDKLICFLAGMVVQFMIDQNTCIMVPKCDPDGKAKCDPDGLQKEDQQ